MKNKQITHINQSDYPLTNLGSSKNWLINKTVPFFPLQKRTTAFPSLQQGPPQPQASSRYSVPCAFRHGSCIRWLYGENCGRVRWRRGKKQKLWWWWEWWMYQCIYVFMAICKVCVRIYVYYAIKTEHLKSTSCQLCKMKQHTVFSFVVSNKPFEKNISELVKLHLFPQVTVNKNQNHIENHHFNFTCYDQSCQSCQAIQQNHLSGGTL